MTFENTLQFARTMDRHDPLRAYRSKFLIPKVNGKTSYYFTGNSLGLQPKSARTYLQEELDDWATLGVEGHLHARRPWLYYHKFGRKALAGIVGAKPSEVVAMNQLTVNLHLMLVSFYNPTPQRYKIITEKGAFSSDQYAFETQLAFHGQDASKALIELAPREGEHSLRTGDIIDAIHTHGPELALVIFGGVQYYTGQFFDIAAITKAGHAAGAYVGFDLAHAVGNVALQLHKHNVDFAVWCGYKYLNSGPGAIAGAFVHERVASNFSGPRFAGWWGHREKERFQMKKGFLPMPGVEGWQVSNVPVFQAAAHLASLEIFAAAGMKNIRAKSLLLTGYLEFLLQQLPGFGKDFVILTPSDPKQRGAQLSLYITRRGREVFKKITAAGVIADWREPGVIRVAPVALYNTFEDVYTFGTLFRKAWEK